LHGIVLTLWFTIALVQPALVASRRTNIHRRIGLTIFGTLLIIVGVVGGFTIGSSSLGRAIIEKMA
jgi:hypothetical protein